MLIFALIHDEDDDHESNWERLGLSRDLESKGIEIIPKKLLDEQDTRNKRLAEILSGSRYVRDPSQLQQQLQGQQQQQQNPEFLLSGVQYVINHATGFSSIISATLGAWLHGRYGRKVRIKVADVEIEARTQKEVEDLLEKLMAIERASEHEKTS